MVTPTHVTLRVLQTISSIVVLGLSSYITKAHTVTLLHEGPRHLWNEVSVLVFISSLAIVTIYAVEFIPYFTKKALNPYILFLSQALIGGLYFGTFIAMAVSVSKIHHCSGSMCSILRADVVFAALSYAFFITSATIQAISLSRARKEGMAIKEIGDEESEGGRKSFA